MVVSQNTRRSFTHDRRVVLYRGAGSVGAKVGATRREAASITVDVRRLGSLLCFETDALYRLVLGRPICNRQFIVMQFGSFRGSIPSESIQNRAHTVCARLYDAVVNRLYNRRWHAFLQNSCAGVVHLVQCKSADNESLCWRIHLDRDRDVWQDFDDWVDQRRQQYVHEVLQRLLPQPVQQQRIIVVLIASWRGVSSTRLPQRLEHPSCRYGPRSAASCARLSDPMDPHCSCRADDGHGN